MIVNLTHVPSGFSLLWKYYFVEIKATRLFKYLSEMYFYDVKLVMDDNIVILQQRSVTDFFMRYIFLSSIARENNIIYY